MAVGILIASSLQNVNATPYLSPQDLYKQSNMVFYGQIISKQTGPGPDYYYYQIKVETYFKNPQNSDSITVAGHKADNKTRMSYPQFEVGDKAIFYTSKLEGINTISPYSQKAGEACGIHSFLGPAPIPGEPIERGVPIYRIYLEDANGNVLYKAMAHHQIVLRNEDVWNDHPESRNVTVETSIQNGSDEQTILHKKQNLEMQACSGPRTVEWDFVPTQSGNYVATIIIDNKTTISTSFEVKDSTNIDTNSIHVMIPNNLSNKNCSEKNNCYVPENVTIPEGGIVTWTNNDSIVHTVTSGTSGTAGEFFDSQIITPGGSFEHVFTDSGIYPYFDQIHPWITGTVIVGNGTFSKTKHLEPLVPRTVATPLRQFESGTDPYKVKCEGNLVLIVSRNGLPACVKESTAGKLWDQGWIGKSTEIYTKYANPQTLKEFQSKIISKEQALKIVQNYIIQKKLNLNDYTNDPRFEIDATLDYVHIFNGSSYNNLFSVDPHTGLPTTIIHPLETNYYRNPQWWSELEKDYLGMQSNRIENGNLVWTVVYRDCPNCIANYPTFSVDAITGKVLLAYSN